MWWRFGRDELNASDEHDNHSESVAVAVPDALAVADTHARSRDPCTDSGPGTSASPTHRDAVRDPAGRRRRRRLGQLRRTERRRRLRPLTAKRG